MQRSFALSLVALSLVPTIAFGADLLGRAEIVDGDTIKVGETTIRLHGIDAPEAGQKCDKASSGTWACGTAATDALAALAEGRDVTCNVKDQDGYGRTIATCSAGDININEKLVRDGHAWAFVKYADDYVGVEQEARASGLGVFQAPTMPPWEYRAQRWNVAAQEAPEGCPIKGNISNNGRIYHPPWSPWYSRTKISIDKGERWFCSEREAVEAGWRAPAWR